MPSDGKTSHGLLRNVFFNFFEQDFVYAFFFLIVRMHVLTNKSRHIQIYLFDYRINKNKY